MVKYRDAPYLSIIGHVLAASLGDQEEYISAVTLIILKGYREWKCGFCSYDKGHVGALGKESRMRSMMVHSFQIKSQGLILDGWEVR